MNRRGWNRACGLRRSNWLVHHRGHLPACVHVRSPGFTSNGPWQPGRGTGPEMLPQAWLPQLEHSVAVLCKHPIVNLPLLSSQEEVAEFPLISPQVAKQHSVLPLVSVYCVPTVGITVHRLHNR